MVLTARPDREQREREGCAVSVSEEGALKSHLEQRGYTQYEGRMNALRRTKEKELV